MKIAIFNLFSHEVGSVIQYWFLSKYSGLFVLELSSMMERILIQWFDNDMCFLASFTQN